MSNPGHTSPGSLRPGYRLLPDGRGSMVTIEQLSSGFQLRADRIVDWGTLYSTLEGVDCSGPRAHLAGLRLTGGQEARQMPGGGAWVWVREYEVIHATEETRVGRDIISKDEDGRRTLAREWVQFSSNAFVEADPSVAVTVAGVKYTLATERAADAGNIRRISRTYVQSTAVAGTADEIGPVVIDYPFDELGDASHVIAAQSYQQAADSYAPLALNSTRVVKVGGANQTLYCIGDGRPQRYGVADVRFTRRWANKPATRTEPDDLAFSFPGYRWASDIKPGREGFSIIVPAQVTYEFFRIGAGGDYATPEAIPLTDRQAWIQKTGYDGLGSTRLSALEIYLNDSATFTGTGSGGGGFTTYGLQTSPTRTAYEALIAAGTYNLVADCRRDRYEGNFYVRRTWKVKAQ